MFVVADIREACVIQDRHIFVRRSDPDYTAVPRWGAAVAHVTLRFYLADHGSERGSLVIRDYLGSVMVFGDRINRPTLRRLRDRITALAPTEADRERWRRQLKEYCA